MADKDKTNINLTNLEEYNSYVKAKYVDLTSAQKITGAKTFSAYNTFTNETHFTNGTYAPTFSDIGSNIGKSSCFTRSAMMQTIVGQVIAPNVAVSNDTYKYNIAKDTIRFQKIDSTSGGQPILSDLAVLSSSAFTYKGNNLATENYVDSAIPTDNSQLANGSNYITKAVSDLTNYYTKSNTYTKDEVKTLIGNVKTIQVKKVDSLPSSGESNYIYLIADKHGTNDIYDEYIYFNSAWEKIGNTDIDLSDYAKKSSLEDYVALEGAQEISGQKMFTAKPYMPAGVSFNSKNSLISYGVIDTHPESSYTNISYFMNDLAGLMEKGGHVTIEGTATSLTETSAVVKNWFDGTTSYGNFTVSAKTDTVVITIKSHTAFSYGQTVGIGFGSSSWRANSVKIEIGYSPTYSNSNSTFNDDIVWISRYSTTTNSAGLVSVDCAGPNASEGGVAARTWQFLRFTLTNWNTTSPRIAGIWAINYSSSQLASTLIPQKGSSSIFGSLTPVKTTSYTLGTSSKQWSSVYAYKLYENGTALSEKYQAKGSNYVTLDGEQTFTGTKKLNGAQLKVQNNNINVSDGLASDESLGLTLYSNAVYISSPSIAYDAGWIRTLGTGESDTEFEMAMGDDGGTGESMYFRYYNTSGAVAYQVAVPKKTGTIALDTDLADKQDKLTAGDNIVIQNNVIKGAYPNATDTNYGIVKLYSSTKQTVPVGSVSSVSNRTYGIQTNGDGKLVVNVPWSNSTYTTATYQTKGLTMAWKSHSKAATGITAVSVTDSTAVALNAISTTTGRYYGVELDANGRGFVNVPWTDTTYSAATTSAAGLMSALDKERLDSLWSNKISYLLPDGSYTISGSWTFTGTTYLQNPVIKSTSNSSIAFYGRTASGTGNITYSLPTYDCTLATQSEVDGKQKKLVSGTNIKTINGSSILGSGNLTVTATVTVDSSISSTSANPVQNKVIYPYLLQYSYSGYGKYGGPYFTTSASSSSCEVSTSSSYSTVYLGPKSYSVGRLCIERRMALMTGGDNANTTVNFSNTYTYPPSVFIQETCSGTANNLPYRDNNVLWYVGTSSCVIRSGKSESPKIELLIIGYK